MIYLLDTNVIAYLIKHKDLKLFNKFEEIAKKHQIGISSITYAEICHELEKKNSEKLKIKVLTFLEIFEIYPF